MLQEYIQVPFVACTYLLQELLQLSFTTFKFTSTAGYSLNSCPSSNLLRLLFPRSSRYGRPLCDATMNRPPSTKFGITMHSPCLNSCTGFVHLFFICQCKNYVFLAMTTHGDIIHAAHTTTTTYMYPEETKNSN